MNPIADGFKISDVIMPAVAFSQSEMTDIFYNLRNDDSAPMLLESCTPEEADIRMNPGVDQVLEAVTAVYNRLDRTMSALVRVLNRYANTVQVVGKPFLGPNRKNNLFAYKTVTFTFSDEQTVSILFHSPGRDPLKFVPEDTLIAYRWMLNRRDITATVSPERGRDINLQTMARRIMQLVEENSQKFQERNAERKQEEERFNQLQEESAQVNSKVEALTQENADLSTRIEDIDLLITRLKERLDNKELEQPDPASGLVGDGAEQHISPDEVDTGEMLEWRNDIGTQQVMYRGTMDGMTATVMLNGIQMSAPIEELFKPDAEGEDGDQNKYPDNVVSVYLTQSGKEGAVIKARGNGYSYSGEWGAGSLNADDMLKQVRQWKLSKRGLSLSHGVDFEDHVSLKGASEQQFNFSAVIRDTEGNPYHVNSRRGFNANVAPFINGKPEIHNGNPSVDLSDYTFADEWWDADNKQIVVRSKSQGERGSKYSSKMTDSDIAKQIKSDIASLMPGVRASVARSKGHYSVSIDDIPDDIDLLNNIYLEELADHDGSVASLGYTLDKYTGGASKILSKAKDVVNQYHGSGEQSFSVVFSSDFESKRREKELDDYISTYRTPGSADPTPAENTPPASLADLDAALARDVARSLSTIAGIDSGEEKGYNRSLFVSSIANKIKTRAKRGETEIADAALRMVAEFNANAIKPALTQRNSVWKATGNSYQDYAVSGSPEPQQEPAPQEELQQPLAPELQDQPPEAPAPEENAGEPPVSENQDRADALSAALEQLLNETDAAKLEKDLDDLAEQAEAEGLMDELDAALNNAADRLSELLAQEAANVA